MRINKRFDTVRRMRALLKGTLLAALPVLLLASVAAAKPFPVFDAFLYMNKPDLTKQGLSRMRLIYAEELWTRPHSMDTPDEATVTKVAKRLDPSLVTCVDIEHWPVVGKPDQVKASIAKYASVISLIRKQSAGVKLGYYGMLPNRDYGRALKYQGQRKYDEWLMENIKMKELAAVVDVVFPSLYTFFPNQSQWVAFAVENLKEAKKFGKPVYAFLWPMYHEASPQKGEYIPADYWRLQLETCYKHADGIVLWGGYLEPWDENAPWWVETKKFMKSHNITSISK